MPHSPFLPLHGRKINETILTDPKSLEKISHMQNLITSQARALHSNSFPSATFSVITYTKELPEYADTFFPTRTFAQVIAYSVGEQGEWLGLDKSEGLPEIEEALADLFIKLQKELGSLMDMRATTTSEVNIGGRQLDVDDEGSESQNSGQRDEDWGQKIRRSLADVKGLGEFEDGESVLLSDTKENVASGSSRQGVAEMWMG
ncbi:hypothetical protein P280DRAFT_521475 [Massarina eburnea CBS 473.64]|uniref:Uncharacterized protein n=1 Tax=Massarina eburnea CBS 473.64 TaxID=1395130 RepID=A0A6A6RQS1_9PLEO|nr:hypothetical protein P280DRAFT_521475 [Massarina eburnea CBS 473.64]